MAHIQSIPDSVIQSPVGSSARSQFVTEVRNMLLPQPELTSISARATAAFEIYSYLILNSHSSLALMRAYPKLREVIHMKTRLFLQEAEDGDHDKVRSEIRTKLVPLLKVTEAMCQRAAAV